MSLDGRTVTGQILSTGAASTPATTGSTSVQQPVAVATNAVAPACQITAISTATGVGTAKINATGQVSQLTLTNSAQLPQLRVGQGVYANFTTKQVSLDGRTIAGQIVSIGATPPKPRR